MTAQGPWKMSRSSINIRQVSIIVCPFSSALICAISEMWKRQIIWGCGRRWPLFSFNQDAYDVSLWEIWHSSLPLWIFCQGCYYFHYHSIRKMLFHLRFKCWHTHMHTHTHTQSHTCKLRGARTRHWLCTIGCYLISIILMMRPPANANVQDALSLSLSGSAEPTVYPLKHK